MREPEIQSSTTLLFRSGKVFLLLLLRHGIPLTVTLAVAPHVITIGQCCKDTGEK